MEPLTWLKLIEINDLIRSTGLTYLKYLLWILIAVGLIRIIYRYAKAAKIDIVENSMWIIRFLDWVGIKFGWNNKSYFLDTKTQEPIPVGINPVGLLLDIIIIVIICSTILFIWPLAFVFSVTIVPIQLYRNYNMRKKEFVSKLKGKK